MRILIYRPAYEVWHQRSANLAYFGPKHLVEHRVDKEATLVMFKSEGWFVEDLDGRILGYTAEIGGVLDETNVFV